MKTLRLGKRGYTTKVDDVDYKQLHELSWSYDGRYACRETNHKKIYLHSTLVKAPDGMTIDHINGDKLDNRRKNLRVVSYSVNCRNRIFPNKSSGLRGVSWSKRSRKWVAQITVDYKNINLGYYPTKQEARAAYVARIKTLEPYE